MGMKINAHLPIPADLKAEYPLSSQILKLKEKRDPPIQFMRWQETKLVTEKHLKDFLRDTSANQNPEY